jgi:CheY-like chemotaxis protein
MSKLFKYRILLVDDEASIRQTSQAILQMQGYEVVTAEDGLDALQCLSGPLPDLLVTDLRMPKMSGFELLAVVRRRFPQIPTIAISGEYVTGMAPEGLIADAFLLKGHYEAQAYFAKIKELLSKPPSRPFPGTQTISPIWVPVRGSGEVVVTCPQCLRSYDIDAKELGVGLHRSECSFCRSSFEFNVDESNMEVVRKSKLAVPRHPVR